MRTRLKLVIYLVTALHQSSRSWLLVFTNDWDRFGNMGHDIEVPLCSVVGAGGERILFFFFSV